MRSFNDPEGNAWQVAVLDASYGNALLVFSQLGADKTLKHELYAANLADAEEELAGMDTDALRQALAEAEPWQ